MNNKLLLSACLTFLCGLAGCRHYNIDNTPPCSGPGCPNGVIEEKITVRADYICQDDGSGTPCPEDQFVNYTRTAADFREYGERTPRDRMISQSGAGNNLAATIPPSIEDEVIEYEDQIEQENPVQEETSAEQAPVKNNEQTETKNAVASESSEDITEEVTEETSADGEETEEIVEETEAGDENSEEATEEIIEETSEDGEEEAQEENPFADDVQDWVAEEGQNLKALLTEWSARSGWRLVWNTNRNYVLNAGAMFRGRFADVSAALIRAFARARPAPVATFYKGNRVLVVETMEDENAYE